MTDWTPDGPGPTPAPATEPKQPPRPSEPPPTPTPQSKPQPPSATTAPAQKDTKSKGNGAIIGLSIVIVLLIIGGLAFFFLAGPNNGSIGGTIRPANAQVFIGDDPIEVSTNGRFMIEDLEPGQYTLTFRAEGHQDESETVTVEAGASFPVAMVLSPAEETTPPPTKTGLAVMVQPEGASIFIDNQKRTEVTPAPFISLPPGQHDVRIEKENYLALSDQVTIAEGAMSTLSKQLQPEFITVNLKLAPEKARCTLHQEGQDDERVSDSFKVMPHRDPNLECDARGYEPKSTEIELPSDGTLVASLDVSLQEDSSGGRNTPPQKVRTPRSKTTSSGGGRESTSTKVKTQPTPPPQPPPSGNGYLSVNTRPWTKVYVDGRFIRNTPLMRHEVPAGSHRLTLINEDFNIRETVPVRVKSGENTQVVRNLVQ